MWTTWITHCNEIKKDQQVICIDHTILVQISGTRVRLVRTGTEAVDEDNHMLYVDLAVAAAHLLQSLHADGTWLIVEPFAHDKLKLKLNPVGRMYFSLSTMICTPASKSQEVGLALGAIAGGARLRDVVTCGSFTHFRRATETPFNLILEARP